MSEMAMPTARAIRPDMYRKTASLLPTHFVLGVYPDYTSGLLSLLLFPAQQQYTLCRPCLTAGRRTSLPLSKLANKCRCPSPVMNDED